MAIFIVLGPGGCRQWRPRERSPGDDLSSAVALSDGQHGNWEGFVAVGIRAQSEMIPHQEIYEGRAHAPLLQ